jgi:hypothetical protein
MGVAMAVIGLAAAALAFIAVIGFRLRIIAFAFVRWVGLGGLPVVVWVFSLQLVAGLFGVFLCHLNFLFVGGLRIKRIHLSGYEFILFRPPKKVSAVTNGNARRAHCVVSRSDRPNCIPVGEGDPWQTVGERTKRTKHPAKPMTPL